MIKKLRKMLYDLKVKNSLKNIAFDDFAWYGDSATPAFISKKGKGEVNEVFFPQTEKSFKLAFEKLKHRFFKKVSYVQTKERLEDYVCYFGLDKEVVEYCMDIYRAKNNMISSKNI